MIELVVVFRFDIYICGVGEQSERELQNYVWYVLSAGFEITSFDKLTANNEKLCFWNIANVDVEESRVQSSEI